jgi:hypothetical protein
MISMPGLALTIMPAVLTLLFGGQPTHTGLGPTSRIVLMGHVSLAARPLAVDPFLSAATEMDLHGTSAPPALSKRFIVIGSAAAGLAGGGLQVLLPGPRPRRENPRITLRLGRDRTASASFGGSF